MKTFLLWVSELFCFYLPEYFCVSCRILSGNMIRSVLFSFVGQISFTVLPYRKCLFFSKYSYIFLGKRGTGKTALLQRIEQQLSDPPYKIHIEKLNCKTLKGKSGESLQRHLFPIIVRLICYQPSALIFDDFDVICAKTFSPEPPTPESLYYDR